VRLVLWLCARSARLAFWGSAGPSSADGQRRDGDGRLVRAASGLVLASVAAPVEYVGIVVLRPR